jgi:hypothetical protein
MTSLLFSFTINSDTKEVIFAGNISPNQALPILQQIVIQNEIAKATNKETKHDSSKDVCRV